jgi:hypothetical protein
VHMFQTNSMKIYFTKMVFMSILFGIGCGVENKPKDEVNKHQNPINQQPDFSGVLEFKVNGTTIKDLSKLKYRLRESPLSCIQGSEKTVVSYDLKIVKSARIFEIDSFRFQSIDFINTELLFFRDTLVKIECISSNRDLSINLVHNYPNNLYNDSTDTYTWYNQEIIAKLYTNYCWIDENNLHQIHDKESDNCLLKIFDRNKMDAIIKEYESFVEERRKLHLDTIKLKL